MAKQLTFKIGNSSLSFEPVMVTNRLGSLCAPALLNDDGMTVACAAMGMSDYVIYFHDLPRLKILAPAINDVTTPDDNFPISGFDGRSERDLFAADFSFAKPLDRSGSTCDAYECIVQRRRVFVKQLKAVYRNNPLYRAAFDKEYDLGVSLSHPSLPHYVGFGGDHIVMDFIEGDTLADLIKRDDPRLKNRKFVRRLLLELVDVVDYLHRRNIVHCDIKADNVIVSPYDDRPATLIDLDKAYTSWLDSTHGNTQKYGCDNCADGVIDYRGLGKIAETLRQNKVAWHCAGDNVSAESIKKILNPGNRNTMYLTVAAMLILWVALSF